MKDAGGREAEEGVFRAAVSCSAKEAALREQGVPETRENGFRIERVAGGTPTHLQSVHKYQEIRAVRVAGRADAAKTLHKLAHGHSQKMQGVHEN
jgi:hypothetical protein